MISKVKKIVKKIIKWDNLMDSNEFDPANFSKALKDYTDAHPETLCEHRSIGKRLDNKDFSPAIKEIGEAFDFFSRDIHEFGNPDIKRRTEYDNFQSGTPLKWKPFKYSVEAIKKSLKSSKLYMYPTGIGNARNRKKIVEYLVREGFKLEKNDNYDGLGINNVAFTVSISQAYAMICNFIARPEDVIILTGPNYGLFAIEADRYNARVEILDLREEDGWFVNSQLLGEKIDSVNKRLTKEFSGKLDYTPKVVAFLNMNPHNPIGNVMNSENVEILNSIAEVCLEKGVFVIDDLIYRDLGYDNDNLAIPMASNPKYFNNTISLFGISKAYGLASFRAGFIVAPTPIIHKIEDKTFQTVLSTPALQVEACSGAYNGSNKRYRYYKKYFKKLIPEYKYRYQLFKAMVDGINSVKDEKLKNKIVKDIKKYIKGEEELKVIFKGIPNVSIRKGVVPKSGFFAVLDFTKLKGKTYDDNLIENDYDLLKYFYIKGKVEYIMGKSMSWPNKEEIIGRISFALTKKAMIDVMYIINTAVRDLK